MAAASAITSPRANDSILVESGCVIRFVFSVEDLARMRFAISPMWEVIRSLSGRLGGIPLEEIVALIPPRGYAPDFLTPAPIGPLGRIEDDLAALRRTPVKQI